MSMFMMRLQPSLPDDVLRRHFCVLSAMPMTVFGHGCCYTHTHKCMCVYLHSRPAIRTSSHHALDCCGIRRICGMRNREGASSEGEQWRRNTPPSTMGGRPHRHTGPASVGCACPWSFSTTHIHLHCGQVHARSMCTCSSEYMRGMACVCA